MILDEEAGHLRRVGAGELHPCHLPAGEEIIRPLGDRRADKLLEHRARGLVGVVEGRPGGRGLADALALRPVGPGKRRSPLRDRRDLVERRPGVSPDFSV